MRWTEEAKKIHSERLKGRKNPPDHGDKIRQGRLRNKKSNVERFLRSKKTQRVLHKKTLNEDEVRSLERWFEKYPVEKCYDWFEQLAVWINLGRLDFTAYRDFLAENRLNEKAFICKWGEIEGHTKFQQWNASRATVWNEEYWKLQGFSEQEAKEEVSRRQTKNAIRAAIIVKGLGGSHSKRCVPYYTSRGMSRFDAEKAVSQHQTRDRDFFINRYGEEDGIARFLSAKRKRLKTWETKDRREHALKTLNFSFNENGQESRAIKMFIDQNGLETYKSVYGSPSEQFVVDIPNIGHRRFDLALFDNDRLAIIFEYHGQAHINFSHFGEEIRDEIVWDNKGKRLPYNVTFGEVYDNDRIKKSYIESHYPDALYIVAWHADLLAKDLKIETLQRRLQDRISKPVLHDRAD